MESSPSAGLPPCNPPASRCMRGAALLLDVSSLLLFKTPVQERIGDVPAVRLGLGHSAPENLALRRRLDRPGAPFGGLGFFDPGEASDVDLPGAGAPSISAEALVRATKLQEFALCAEFRPSFYFWALQPIFDTSDHVVGAEIVLRAKNGSDCAPYEDLQAIVDPAAPDDVRTVYTAWKAAEIISWPLRFLRKNLVLQKLQFITVNLRPSDLNTSSPIFQEVVNRLLTLSDEERELLLSVLVIEVTEDQEHPEDIETSLQAWKELGFRCAYDDTIGDLACTALGKHRANFHTTSALNRLLATFWLVKVDIEWAGHMLFLCHPSLSSRASQKAEVLRHARDDDLVYVPEGPLLKNTEVKHSEALAEFAAWARRVISRGIRICIELTVSRDDANCALALARLGDLGIDIFGEHAAHFCFQGGPCGPRAFAPEVLAAACTRAS